MEWGEIGMKSVIVIDTPKNCWNCLLRHEYKESEICALADDIIYNCSSKPDWCPLVPLPEKQLIWNDDDDYFMGYNECIDEILKETENE